MECDVVVVVFASVVVVIVVVVSFKHFRENLTSGTTRTFSFSKFTKSEHWAEV